jgi:hypothetical protein
LMATILPSFSRAKNTSAIPPTASRRMSSYLPKGTAT